MQPCIADAITVCNINFIWITKDCNLNNEWQQIILVSIGDILFSLVSIDDILFLPVFCEQICKRGRCKES